MLVRLRIQISNRTAPDDEAWPEGVGGVSTAVAEEPEVELFRTVSLQRRSRWLPWLASLVVHAALIALLPTLADLASYIYYDTGPLTANMAEPLRLRTPFYFTPEVPEPPPPPPRRKRALPKPAAPAPRRAPVAAEERPRPPVRQFEMPEIPQPARPGPVLLQPQIKTQAPRVNVPTLAFWARGVPKRVHKEFIAPGRTEVPASAPNLSAPPVLAVPNRESALADINIAAALPQFAPVLPAPPSATAPVRTSNEAPPRAASLDPLQGEAADVISMNDAITHRLSAGELVTIPNGLINAPKPQQPEAPVESSPGSNAGRGANPARATNSGAGPGRGNASSQANGPNPGRAAGAGTSRGNGSSQSHTVIPAAGAPRPTEPSMPLIRIEHPATGSFDVVVRQSTVRADLPEIGGMLTGNPVYTVYLRVGDQKEWLLEFCVPNTSKPQVNPYKIVVGAPVRIAPPYPLLTLIPNNIAELRHPKYLAVHGFLTAEGQFRDVSSPDGDHPLIQALLGPLAQWRFRPAARDNQPVEVEVLLLVPPRS